MKIYNEELWGSRDRVARPAEPQTKNSYPPDAPLSTTSRALQHPEYGNGSSGSFNGGGQQSEGAQKAGNARVCRGIRPAEGGGRSLPSIAPTSSVTVALLRSIAEQAERRRRLTIPSTAAKGRIAMPDLRPPEQYCTATTCQAGDSSRVESLGIESQS